MTWQGISGVVILNYSVYYAKNSLSFLAHDSCIWNSWLRPYRSCIILEDWDDVHLLWCL
jgi:hypothetical protein